VSTAIIRSPVARLMGAGKPAMPRFTPNRTREFILGISSGRVEPNERTSDGAGRVVLSEEETLAMKASTDGESSLGSSILRICYGNIAVL